MYKICCAIMTDQVEAVCEQHPGYCPDQVIMKSHDGKKLYLASGNAEYHFTYCPWCGEEVNITDPDELVKEVHEYLMSLSKEEMIQNLKDIGILDENGKLSPSYQKDE